MCRDGYRVTCAEGGCGDQVTCRDQNGYCHQHDLSSWYYEDDEPPLVLASAPDDEPHIIRGEG